MSTINNLHSLLGGKWMITEEYANSLTPYLLSILSKGQLPANGNLSKGELYSFLNSSGEVIEASSSTQENRIAVLHIKGPILKYSQECGPMGTVDMMAKMEEWKYQDNIIGVLHDYDTGGGQIAGTPLFAEYIHEYNKVKPVIAYTEGVIASAGLYLASGCKEVIAHKHAMCIGSLGTMYKGVDTDGIIEKMGGKVIEAYAEKSTKKNNAIRKAKQGDLKPLIKEELNPLNEKFHKEVMTYMPSIKPEALNGQHTYEIEKAKELGLITKIADRQYAIDRIFELAKESTTHKNESDMSAENQTFPALAGVLGQEEIKASKKILTGKTGVFLNISELQAIEGKLSGHNEALAALQTKVDDGNTKITSLEASETSINGAVENALKTADIEAGEDTQASIKLLGDKVAEYGAKPGAKGTTITSTGDRQEGEGAESTSIFDSIVK